MFKYWVYQSRFEAETAETDFRSVSDLRSFATQLSVLIVTFGTTTAVGMHPMIILKACIFETFEGSRC